MWPWFQPQNSLEKETGNGPPQMVSCNSDQTQQGRKANWVGGAKLQGVERRSRIRSKIKRYITGQGRIVIVCPGVNFKLLIESCCWTVGTEVLPSLDEPCQESPSSCMCSLKPYLAPSDLYSRPAKQNNLSPTAQTAITKELNIFGEWDVLKIQHPVVLSKRNVQCMPMSSHHWDAKCMRAAAAFGGGSGGIQSFRNQCQTGPVPFKRARLLAMFNPASRKSCRFRAPRFVFTGHPSPPPPSQPVLYLTLGSRGNCLLSQLIANQSLRCWMTAECWY